MSCGVYAIVNKVNDKPYIGSSKDIEDRWYGSLGHFTLLRKGTHDNRYLQAAFDKYGESNFIPEIWELTSEKKRLKREQWYLDEIGMDNLYNLSPRAGGGRQSEETIKKIGDAARNFYQTPEGREVSKRHSKFMKGCKHTEEANRKISEKMKGKQNAKGYKHTEEELEKMRKPMSEEAKEKIRNRMKDPEVRRAISEKLKGRIPWNKGLTKETDERVKLSEGTKEKLRGKVAWNKGLTKETDERVAEGSERIREVFGRKHEVLSSAFA